MKKNITLVLFIVFATITGIITCRKTVNHVCSDPRHITCDGKCECDGMGCPTPGYEYQITLEPDSLILTQGKRHIAIIGYDQIGKLDSIFIADNE